MSELPVKVQRNLYVNFLNYQFWDTFKKYFTMPDFSYKLRAHFQNFDTHEVYGAFIISIVQNLEPISYKPGEIIK